jgi:dCMP deaminase
MISPSWDYRFIALAEHIASWSKDPSTQIGAVIVDDERKIVSVGYNGFPAGLDDQPQRLIDRPTKYSMTIHGEMNACINSPRPVKGCTLYTWPFMSCDRCAVHMISYGIKRVVAPELPAHLEDRWLESITKSKAYFAEAGVIVSEY